MNIKNTALRVYLFIRLPLIYLLKVLFRPYRVPSGKVEKILIIRLDRLGDLVLSIPLIDNLRLKYPDARITLFVRPYLKEMAGMIKSATDVVIYEGNFSSIGRIRKERYDIAIDMQCDYEVTSAFLAYLSAAPVRIGFQWGYRELFFTGSVRPFDFPGKHMVELDLELLKLLKVPVKVTEPRIKLAQPLSEKKKMIALHPGGYYPSQRWPKEFFVQLARKIMDEMKEEIVFLGGPDDAVLMDDIVNDMGDRKYKILVSGVKDMAHILEDCKVLVCNNSGPMHLAAALGVPTVSTMGPSDPVLWWPRGSNNVVIRKTGSVERITVDEMYDAVKKVTAHK
jgi:heptosyltransferase II